ncbi:hypothetical protein YERSI8AC_80001 [Enterobacterales bacterium 8AC]|nr:hypothetical protein YERSI8AC_80001 [Enterobacterales bacterium 8AC]
MRPQAVGADGWHQGKLAQLAGLPHTSLHKFVLARYSPISHLNEAGNNIATNNELIIRMRLSASVAFRRKTLSFIEATRGDFNQ